jgi:predicted O-methyltransferase YrrM
MSFPESKFTPSCEWCEHPEWWHSDDDEATENEVTELVAAFVRAIQPEVVIETGTYHGQTAQAIGEALKANGHGELITIEVDNDRCDLAEARCDGLPVSVLRGSSLDFLESYHGSPVGFAWLDSGQIRHDELELVSPHLAPGAVVGVHDTGPQHQVMSLLSPVISAHGLQVISLRTPRGVTFLQA